MDEIPKLGDLANKGSFNIEKNLVRWHHLFMCQYGWISLEEFKNLPIPTYFSLRECISEDIERANQNK